MKFIRAVQFIAILLWAPTLLASENVKTILVMGDSLSAGYGIKLEEGWVHLLQERIQGQYPYTVINASVSGETTGGGSARLPALLEEHQPAIVVLELGGNDGLRGHPVNIMRRNLQEMIALSDAAKAQVVLLGMHIPPNYGARYTRIFNQTYAELAQENRVPIVPFFLDGVAGDAKLMQRDGIHPTADAQVTMLNHVWPVLEPLLK